MQKVKHLILISFTLLYVAMASGQSLKNLKRNVFLGARLMSLSDVEEDLGTDSGIYLLEIIPTGSLGEMEVPAGAVLQQINETPIHSMSDLSGALAGIKQGDDLKVVVFENGKKKTFQGLASGRPIEHHPNAQIEYGVVGYEGNNLRSFLYLPNGVEKPPVVFFIQGYLCQTIEMQSDNPAKQLIDKWIQKGVAVFLVEKPGMGDSESKVPCIDIDFNQEFLGFSKAYESLEKNSKIDAENIFLFGHSMGGVISPLLALEYKPAGVMVYGIVGTNWYDYMVDVYTEQPLIMGVSNEQIKENVTYYLPFIKDMLIHKKSNLELIESSIYGEKLKEDGVSESLAQGYFIQRHYRFWQTLADIDIPKTWSRVKVPVLVLHGEFDIQAIHPKYSEMIVKNVNEHEGKASFQLFPKTEHAFLKFDSREDLNNILGNGTYGQYFSTNFNADIAKISVEWLRKNEN